MSSGIHQHGHSACSGSACILVGPFNTNPLGEPHQHEQPTLLPGGLLGDLTWGRDDLVS